MTPNRFGREAKPTDRHQGNGTELVWYWTEQGVKAQIDEVARLSRHIDSSLALDLFDLSLENYNLAKDNNSILKDTQKTQQHEVREKDRAKIMAWLSPLEFYRRQNVVLKIASALANGSSTP